MLLSGEISLYLVASFLAWRSTRAPVFLLTLIIFWLAHFFFYSSFPWTAYQIYDKYNNTPASELPLPLWLDPTSNTCTSSNQQLALTLTQSTSAWPSKTCHFWRTTPTQAKYDILSAGHTLHGYTDQQPCKDSLASVFIYYFILLPTSI